MPANYNGAGNQNVNWAPMNNQPGTWTPPGQYQQYNPYGYRWNQPQFIPQSAPQPAPQSYSNLIKVSGMESVKAYPMGPNQDLAMFHGTEPIFYLVSTDDSGFKSIREFNFYEKDTVDQDAEPHANVEAFATKEDVDDMKKEISDIRKMLKELM